jgi:hypothetical protein
MDNRWIRRPEIAIPAALIAVWVTVAAVYAAVFSY